MGQLGRTLKKIEGKGAEREKKVGRNRSPGFFSRK